MFQSRFALYDRQVGHAPQVQDQGGAACPVWGRCRRSVPKHRLMKSRNQGRALSTGCKVSASEIGHHGNTGEFGQ